MEKPVAAIELCSKQIKLVIGYELNGKVYVIYTLTKSIDHLIQGGNFLDMNSLVSELSTLRDIIDPTVKLKVHIADALLALPAFGLKVCPSVQQTAVIDKAKIGDMDIRNIYALFKNTQERQKTDQNYEFIEAVPEEYALDNDRRFKKPPFGESSLTLAVKAKIQSLPIHIKSDYSTALKKSGINVKRNIISSFSACELLATYPEIPENYILVDIGSHTTTVSLIGNKQLYASRFFNWGGDNITEKIVLNFNINEADAEKFKIMYGIDNRKLNFKAPICNSVDGEGNEIKHYANEMNDIIKKELDEFTKTLNLAIGEFKTKDPIKMKRLPMVLIGGGSRLIGLVDYIKPKVESDEVIAFVPKNMGARNPSLVSCLGMILVNAKYPSIDDESQPRIGQVTRDPIK